MISLLSMVEQLSCSTMLNKLINLVRNINNINKMIA